MLAGRLSLRRETSDSRAGGLSNRHPRRGAGQAAGIKKQIAEGINPAAKRKIDKITGPLANVNSFRAVAEEWLDKARREGRADVTVGKLTWLLEFAYPIIGDRKVGKIKAPELLAVLRSVEKRGITKPHEGCTAPADRCSAIPSPPAAPTGTLLQTCAAH